MIISHELVECIHKEWIRDQEHPHRGRLRRPYPDIDKLAYLLDVAFRASLLNEEGVPVRALLIWLEPNELTTLEIPRRRESELAIRFRTPHEFQPDVIAKLGRATTSRSVGLLVGWFEGRPLIWGALFSHIGRSALEQIPMAIMEARHFRPDCPTLTLTGTGSLLISRGDAVIGRVERGEFHRAVPTPFNSRSMGRLLHALFHIDVEDDKFRHAADARRGHLLFSCLEHLLSQIDRLKRGGTILLIPREAAGSIGTLFDTPWSSTGSLEIARLIETRLRFDEEQQRSKSLNLGVLKANEALRERLNSLANFSTIDGAIVLTEEFELVAFGAKLHATPFQGEVLEGDDGLVRSNRTIEFSRFGTRHNSALAFVCAVPASVAFVASSDGPIRGIARGVDGQVRCWPDCRVSMFT